MDPRTVESLLAGAGVVLHPDGEGRWAAELRMPGGPRPLRLRVTDNWIVMELGPLGPPPPAARRVEVHHAMLRANRRLSIARLAIGEGGEPLARADLPTACLDPEEVRAALAALRDAAARLDAATGTK